MLGGDRVETPGRLAAAKAAFSRVRSVEQQSPLEGQELDNAAFRLIKGFMDASFEATDVQKEVTATYFGRNWGYFLLDESSRDVGVWRGNIFWLIRYDFTPLDQKLTVVRETHVSDKHLEPLRSRTLIAESSRRHPIMSLTLEQLGKLPPVGSGITSWKSVGAKTFSPSHAGEAAINGEELLRGFKSSTPR